MNKHYFRLMIAFAVIALTSVAYYAFRQQAEVRTDESAEPSLEIPAPDSESAASATETLEVQWSAPKSIEPLDVFTQYYVQNVLTYAKEYVEYKQVGTVRSGTHEGAKIVILQSQPEGPSMPEYAHILLPKDGGLIVYLSNHSPAFDSARFDESKFLIDETLVVPDLYFPTAIRRDGTEFVLRGSSFYEGATQKNTSFFDPTLKKLAFTDPVVGKVYMDVASAETKPLHGFYAIAPDSTVRAYALVVPFYDDNVHVPQVTWANGLKNEGEYWMTKMTGCGARNYADVITDVAKDELVTAGTTVQGETIYSLKDANHPILKGIYSAYAPSWIGEGVPSVSYEKFVAAHPAFFWYDAFGRLIEFQSAAFLPAAECGKPVVYLYPEKTTNVSVKLSPQGGFSVTEPAYDGGWNVRATPKSELTNLKDGKTYPYLFWEGRGGLYETPKRGFVVAQNDVHSFLIEKLSALGLNEQERADFIEFWEPRMTGSPWYFVTFMGNQVMDALAPLDVTPKPDTVIRVLMDFLPLEKPIPVEGFVMRPPKREGFTVVEWGGVIR